MENLYPPTLWQRIFEALHLHWLTVDWWRYLIWGGLPEHRPVRVRDWQHFLCRVRGHPCGVVWFNPGGIEPDMHCRDCDDNLD